MSVAPAFEIGVWNAWILMLCQLILYLPLMLFAKERMKSMETPQDEGPRRLYPVITVLWLLAIIYSIFLPLNTGTAWFYTGLPIFILGLIGQSAVCFTICVNPIDDKPLSGGLYRYSRHPYYVTQLIMFIGIGIASASWVFLLFSIVYSVLHFVMTGSEEHSCLEKYGDAYREYMNRTPKWIGIPKTG
jgi:protein-S-isoprenylcysteine O-methyltransferase Ste14